MDSDRDNIVPTASPAQRLAWRTRALAQGLVCLVCGQAPAFEDRDRFYGSHLCGACLEELHFREAPPALG